MAVHGVRGSWQKVREARLLAPLCPPDFPRTVPPTAVIIKHTRASHLLQLLLGLVQLPIHLSQAVSHACLRRQGGVEQVGGGGSSGSGSGCWAAAGLSSAAVSSALVHIVMHPKPAEQAEAHCTLA